jgi:CheY-like chemotaxis protein
MDKIRVLLIDDEPAFTRMLKLNLERRGYEVRVENNGANAHVLARQFRPDFIFLDVIMPDVDGGEVASNIRSDPALQDVPIVFLTAGVSKEKAQSRGGVIGNETYIAKPARVEDVVRSIEQGLKKGRAERRAS